MVLPGQLGNGKQRLPAVHRAGGIVGVDDQNSLRMLRDFGAHILQIRIPVIFRIAAVVNRPAAAEIGIIAPQGIAGRRHQNLVVRTHQGSHQHGNGLTDTVADKNIIHGDALKAPPQVVIQNGLPCSGHAPHIAVGHRLIHMLQQCLADALRHSESEISGIARIQLQHRRSGGLHPQCFNVQRPPNV